MSNKKILFLVNVDWFFVSHRLGIARAAIEKGYEVHLATTVTNQASIIKDTGLILHELQMSRSGSRIIGNLKTLIAIIKIFREVNPRLVHLVTIKPIILGGIAARFTKIHGVIAAVSGLGSSFLDNGIYGKIKLFFIKKLYRISLGNLNIQVICQNQNDTEDVQKISQLPLANFSLIEGSGVSLTKFRYSEDNREIPNVIMASRLLCDKGVMEFVDAARSLKESKTNVNMILVGEPDPDNPSSITKLQVTSWEREGILEYWGHQEDMEKILQQSSIVVLPSYREGFPKILIEAAACGRAVITTDVPGCRDAIYNGVTGILVPEKNAVALADAIKELALNPNLYKEMGKKGRKMAENRFDEKNVISKHLEIYNQLLKH
ncbi:MAG: glycosyltransferase family 1 protein [Euryarchaeota archaeon]|nr:glycosyltransferase family 1 protein [Euryarchaeota archaeon]|tara:strand:- start:9227 stop:10357 length:1131 start_codon:yes stop_codon:yes gene_type:complete